MNVSAYNLQQSLAAVMKVRAGVVLRDVLTSHVGKGKKHGSVTMGRLITEIDIETGENQELKSETYLLLGDVIRASRAQRN